MDQGETFYPLHVRVCGACLLVQLPAYVRGRGHLQRLRLLLVVLRLLGRARRDVRGAAVERLGLDPDSFVVEVASNDGYLLQHVVARGIRCLGIEPAANIAEAARGEGRPDRGGVPGRGDRERRCADRHGPADLVAANNVFAHVPDIVDFAQGPARPGRRPRARSPSRSRTCCG